MGRENQIINERLRKINELKEQNVNVYPQDFEKKNNCLDIQEKYSDLNNEEKTKDIVQIAGRVMVKRDMGRIAFAKVKDESGTVQVVLQEGETDDKERTFFKKYIDSGDIVGVTGIVMKSKRGEVSILVSGIRLLSKSILPLPEKWHGMKDIEERYRKRYLDMIMNDDTMNVFRARSKIISSLRNFLAKEGFTEVETPTIQSLYGGASAKPFITHINALDIDAYLSISPELYLKRLIVGGMEKVFTICKNFRNEGMDAVHNPEFTMMEYYAAYKDYKYHMKFIEEFFEVLKKELNLGEEIEYQGEKISLKTPFKQVKFRDLLIEKIDIDIDEINTFEKLKDVINEKNITGVDVSECYHYGSLLDELYKRVVRPSIVQPTFLTHYPVEMIALAKRNEEDSSKINSVQLLINGAEIFKAYDELNDPMDQEKRLKEQAELLGKGDDDAMPMDEDFINALKIGMPPTAGFGMGIDRLVMLFTGQSTIRDVILFPFMKPEVDSKKEKKK